LGKLVGNLMVFVLLFFIGIWLSMYVRQFLPTGLDLSSLAPSANPTPSAIIEQSSDPYEGWKEYQVVSGVTRQPISGISFKLPSDVLAPICDGTTCASQGTYLPGGTRFTVAGRGIGQSLPDSRGSILIDASGKQFTTREASASGYAGVEFSGDFVGSTIAGYSFTKMHGYMLYPSSSLTVELNHFSPRGVDADFDNDESIFQKIIASFTAPVVAIPTLYPTITTAPISTSSAQ
jgi:hypothetical protein